MGNLLSILSTLLLVLAPALDLARCVECCFGGVSTQETSGAEAPPAAPVSCCASRSAAGDDTPAVVRATGLAAPRPVPVAPMADCACGPTAPASTAADTAACSASSSVLAPPQESGPVVEGRPGASLALRTDAGGRGHAPIRVLTLRC